MRSQITLLAALASMSLASPVGTTNAPRQAEIGLVALDVRCDRGGTSETEKSGFRSFIDRIPDDEVDLNNESKSVGWWTIIDNNSAASVTAELTCEDCDTKVSGKEIKENAHKGYETCVINGNNSKDSERFLSFRVYTDSYAIRVGGETCGTATECTAGV